MKDDRTILWVFLAFIVGFILPVCSCLGLGAAFVSMAGNALSAAPVMSGTGDAVAVIHLDGTIMSSSGGSYVAVITPELVESLLAQAEADPTIQAVVIRVNSPGGSVVASDEIYHMLLDFEKPIVIWMDEMAASGGYYISCGGDLVMAHPDTLTGSIGVISQFINAEELLDEIGVDVTVVTSGEVKDMGSLFRGMTEAELAIWQTIGDEAHASFISIVAEARDLPIEDVRGLADGRVYSGRQALALGLVDELGNSSDAITRAAELAGITGEPRVVELEQLPSLMDTLLGFQSPSSLPALEDVMDWIDVPTVEYRFAGP